MLAFMSLTGIFGWLNLQGIAISILPPEEIYATLPALFTVHMQNRRSFLPHCLLTIHVNGSSCTVPFLASQQSATRRLQLTLAQRGPGTLTEIYISSPFPVNFFVRSTVIQVAADYLVFPRPMPLSTHLADRTEVKRSELITSRKGTSGDVESITAYTGQEPLKLVHWRLSARHDDLLVKEMGSEIGIPVYINLDELPGSLEERLSAATFLINKYMNVGKAVGLLLDGRRVRPAVSKLHRLHLLGELARHA